MPYFRYRVTVTIPAPWSAVRIPLDPALYPVAAVEQEDRRSEDPMELVIAKVFGEITGKILTADAWLVLGIEGRALTPDEMIPFSAAMRRQGWHKSRNRLEAGQREYCYLKGDATQRERWLSVSGKGEFAKVTPSSTEKSRGPTLVGRELWLKLGGKQ